MIRRRRFIAATLVVGALAWASPSAVQAAPPPVEHRQAPGDGLAISSTTTYVVDPSGVVKALAELTLTNTLPDVTEGFTITRRYFTGFALPVPVGATSFVAQSNGRLVGLATRLVPGNTDYFLADVDLPSRLFYRESVVVTVAYDITGFPPRSENPSRVNAAFASFQAYGIGDPGKVTVRVVVPAGFTVETFGDGVTVTEEFGNTVYTATGIQNPDQFDIFIAARDDRALTDEGYTDADGRRFLVRAWPGDAEWIGFVRAQIDEGLPLLEEAIGEEWPIDELVVREAYTPYFYGYAGWFSAVDEEIEMGEELDQETMLHELSHAWFNSDWFHERWVSEGLAQVYSNQVVDQLGGDGFEPTKPIAGDPGTQRLNEWGNPAIDEVADDAEDYGYGASYWVTSMLTDAAGDDGMRAVFDAVANQQIAYRGEVDPEDAATTDADWKRLLDLLQEVGGADDEVVDLFEQYVVVAADADMLDERSAARVTYDELQSEGGKWAAPVGVRTAMSEWAFDDAASMMTAADDVLGLRDELDALSEQLDVSYPSTFETDYEAADEDEMAEVAADLQGQIDAAELLLAAVAAEAADDSVLERIGLIGTDLTGELADARTALSTGNLDSSNQAAQDVIDTVDDAGDVGTDRALTTGGIVLGAMVVALLLLWWRHRRKRRNALAAATATDQLATAQELGGEEAEPIDGRSLEPNGEVLTEPPIVVGNIDPEHSAAAPELGHLGSEHFGNADDGHVGGPTAGDEESVSVETSDAPVDAQDQEGRQPDQR